MEYAVLIEREPGARTVGAYSPDIDVTVIRDASTTDDEILAAFKEALAFHLKVLRDDGLPIPPARHRAAMVAA